MARVMRGFWIGGRGQELADAQWLSGGFHIKGESR